MTEDYKEFILKYATGNLPENYGINEPQIKNLDVITNNLQQQIRAYFDSIVSYIAYTATKDNNNEGLNYTVISCIGTLLGESETSGALVVVDENYDIVQVITEYADGTKIGVVECINIDDEGNFYLVELRGSTYRIVALNNIVLKLPNQSQFKANILETHNIPNSYTWEANGAYKVARNEGKNKYFVLMKRDNAGLVGCELTIGENDEWNYYTTSYEGMSQIMQQFNNGFSAYWDSSGNLHFIIAVDDTGLILLTEGSSNNMVATRYTTNNQLGTFNNFILYSNLIGYYTTIEDYTTYNTITIYRLNLDNKELTQIFTENTAYYSARSQLWFFKSANNIYYYKITSADGSNEYELDFGLINDYAVSKEALGTFTADTMLKTFCYANIINKFNKNTLYIQNQNTLFTCEFEWNRNNYNGQDFISNGSTIPDKASIEDSNEVELFNRNLYNLAEYLNRYTATLQIPNHSLNNDEIYNALLISKNNNILANGNIDTTKNIYEELNVNFINEIKIFDDDTQQENLIAASNLNHAMLNYQTDVYLGKIRLNYHDETTDTKTLSTNELVYNNLSTTYKFVIYINKQLDSIDLISNNELTTYKIIDTSDLEIGKYYLITQDIRIE